MQLLVLKFFKISSQSITNSECFFCISNIVEPQFISPSSRRFFVEHFYWCCSLLELCLVCYIDVVLIFLCVNVWHCLPLLANSPHFFVSISCLFLSYGSCEGTVLPPRSIFAPWPPSQLALSISCHLNLEIAQGERALR